MYVFNSGLHRMRLGEWRRRLGLGFTNPVGIGDVLDVCMCLGCGGVDGVDSRAVTIHYTHDSIQIDSQML